MMCIKTIILFLFNIGEFTLKNRTKRIRTVEFKFKDELQLRQDESQYRELLASRE